MPRETQETCTNDVLRACMCCSDSAGYRDGLQYSWRKKSVITTDGWSLTPIALAARNGTEAYRNTVHFSHSSSSLTSASVTVMFVVFSLAAVFLYKLGPTLTN